MPECFYGQRMRIVSYVLPETFEKFRARAKRNKRSLSNEALCLIEESVQEGQDYREEQTKQAK
jgi:hypothetical protein